VAAVEALKHCGVLSHGVAVFYNPGMAAVMLQTDAGRRAKPVFVAAAVPRLATALRALKGRGDNLFTELRLLGLIAFITPAEEQQMVVATSLEELAKDPEYYTHAAIHATSLFAPSVATMPWANMDQGARQIYRSCHGKQAIAQLQDPEAKRRLAPNTSMSLCYGQRPATQTMYETITTTLHTQAKSQCMSVAVMMLDKSNEEDAIIMCRGSKDRGLGMRGDTRTSKIKTNLLVENMAYGRPGPTCSHRQLSPSGRDLYHAIDTDGMARIGAVLERGDVIVARIMKVFKRTAAGKEVMTLHCASVTTRYDGRVTSLHRTDNEELDVVIVQQFELMKPEKGDKMASRHAQKGIIGAIWPQADMPWSPRHGTVDIVINACAFPSRMTIGQMMEMLVSKGVLMEGQPWADATAYNSDADASIEYWMAVLKHHGLNSHGDDVMYSGITGQPYKCMVATGCVDYEFLRHIAATKCFARGQKGNTVKLTRQPTRGQSGLQVGEMERNAVLGHGAAATYRALGIDNSDPAKVYFCSGCGHSVDAPPRNARMQFAGHRPCRMCKGTNFTVTDTSHGFNLLKSELQAINTKITCTTVSTGE
jgi:DNA-directed RNA polymerase beta subunit